MALLLKRAHPSLFSHQVTNWPNPNRLHSLRWQWCRALLCKRPPLSLLFHLRIHCASHHP